MGHMANQDVTLPDAGDGSIEDITQKYVNKRNQDHDTKCGDADDIGPAAEYPDLVQDTNSLVQATLGGCCARIWSQFFGLIHCN